MQPSVYMSGGIVVLVGWRLYARARRSFGRQTMSTIRLRFSVGLLPLVLVSLGFGALAQGQSIAALPLGALAGACLGWYGLRSTRFEAADGRHYYYPNPWIGVGLVLLLAGRMAYRLLLADASLAGGPPPLTFWTLLSVATLLAYYWTMAFGLLHWRARQLAATLSR
jgi:hypothetical protein